MTEEAKFIARAWSAMHDILANNGLPGLMIFPHPDSTESCHDPGCDNDGIHYVVQMSTEGVMSGMICHHHLTLIVAEMKFARESEEGELVVWDPASGSMDDDG